MTERTISTRQLKELQALSSNDALIAYMNDPTIKSTVNGQELGKQIDHAFTHGSDGRFWLVVGDVSYEVVDYSKKYEDRYEITTLNKIFYLHSEEWYKPEARWLLYEPKKDSYLIEVPSNIYAKLCQLETAIAEHYNKRVRLDISTIDYIKQGSFNIADLIKEAPYV